ncbi:hypothetical protein [Sphingopyxis sp.]|jgi:hypothetical protein|uniref:hypothetical protein n=1 Tax=Sphingopyxis sp. TaxID=1908224 RepID=UPI003F7094C3
MAGAMMRMLVIVGVLLCSLQFCEPASAHLADRDVSYAPDRDDGKQEPREPVKKLAHSGHHHCPMAPDQRQTVSEAPLALALGPLFAAPVVQRPSRELPPLLDPPLV